MAEHHRQHADGEHEWSVASEPSETGAPFRLFVTAGPDALIEITETQVTSGSEEARPLKDAPLRWVVLTDEQARWLLEVLPRALAAREEKPCTDS